MVKADVLLCLQAAIGSTALDMARKKQETDMERYGMDVLTVAVLSILITAPIGSILIGLSGPYLLQKPKNPSAWGKLSYSRPSLCVELT